MKGQSLLHLDCPLDSKLQPKTVSGGQMALAVKRDGGGKRNTWIHCFLYQQIKAKGKQRTSRRSGIGEFLGAYPDFPPQGDLLVCAVVRGCGHPCPPAAETHDATSQKPCILPGARSVAAAWPCPCDSQERTAERGGGHPHTRFIRVQSHILDRVWSNEQGT